MGREEVARKSALVQARFVGLEEFRSARAIALYSSVRNEVQTHEVFSRALGEGKEVFFPRVTDPGVTDPGVSDGSPHLEFIKVAGPDDLNAGSYGILEPRQDGQRLDPGSFDCMVVPGIAFDEVGTRLGYGKGYYDRALASAGCPVVALAFDFQVLGELLPAVEHDVRVDSVVTETRVLRIKH
jgi:5-formyltetrahydrofolate cyclo-ligase